MIPKPDWRARLLVLFLFLVKWVRGNYSVEGLRKHAKWAEGRKLVLPESLTHASTTLADMTCDHLQKKDAKLTLLHFYGGAYCVRLPKFEMPPIAKLCDRINAEAFLPWYPLAPENKFPAGPEAAIAAYQELLDRGVDPKTIVVSGASAGGGLAMSLLYLLKERNLPMPACAFLISPAGDSLMLGDSWLDNAKRDPMFTIRDVLYFAHKLFEPEQRCHPMVNIGLEQDLTGYPPLYSCASSNEVLRDTSVMLHEKATAAGIPSELDIYSGSIHCMPLIPSANQAAPIWTRIETFVKDHTAAAMA